MLQERVMPACRQHVSPNSRAMAEEDRAQVRVCMCANTSRDFRGPPFMMYHQRPDLLKFNAAKVLCYKWVPLGKWIHP